MKKEGRVMLYNMKSCFTIWATHSYGRGKQGIVKKKRKKGYIYIFLSGEYSARSQKILGNLFKNSGKSVLRLHLTQFRYLTPTTQSGCLQVCLSVYWQLGMLWPVLLSGYEMKDCPAEPHSSDVILTFFSLGITCIWVPALKLILLSALLDSQVQVML